VSFKDIIEYAGGKCVYVETDEADGFQLTAEMIERSITPRTRAIILNSPNNPSGAVFDLEDFTAIVKLAHKRGIYVIADECYVYLNFTGNSFSAGAITEAREHMVIVGSFSKTYAMTGWRAGYTVAMEPFMTAIRKIVLYSTNGVATPVQYAMLQALATPASDIETRREEYRKRRDLLVAGLCEVGIECKPPTGAFYAFPNVEKINKSSRAAAQILLDKAHIATIPGVVFGAQGEGHLRFGYAITMREIEDCVEALRCFRP
jgi:aspartate aminotransferase